MIRHWIWCFNGLKYKIITCILFICISALYVRFTVKIRTFVYCRTPFLSPIIGISCSPWWEKKLVCGSTGNKEVSYFISHKFLIIAFIHINLYHHHIFLHSGRQLLLWKGKFVKYLYFPKPMLPAENYGTL